MYAALHRHRPSHRWTNGDLAAQVGADLGLPPDDEQRWILDTIYGEVAPERPSAFEVCVVSPRQNIKTSTFGIAALADLFVFGVERHLWTAHHGDTLKGTFSDFKAWINSNPEYAEQVTFYEGHQDMAIVHKDTGNVIDFQSRTGKAGRGLTGVKRITLDEALYLEPKHIGAVYPTMLTRPGAQVRIGSSAGLLTSDQLRRVRDRGRTGKDKRLAYAEYGAERRACLRTDCSHVVGSEGCALDDRELWWQANCALWAGRIAEESLVDQRASMPPDEFMREFLSWWEDPVSAADGGINPADWVLCADPESRRAGSVALGIAQSDDHSTVSIGVVGRRDDGAYHVELIEHRRSTTSWVAPRVRDLVDKHQPVSVMVDPMSAMAGLIPELETAGVTVDVAKVSDLAASCGRLYDLVKATATPDPEHPDADLLWHLGTQHDLNAAVQSATTRQLQRGGWLWKQAGDAPITPLWAITLALAGYTASDVNYDPVSQVF